MIEFAKLWRRCTGMAVIATALGAAEINLSDEGRRWWAHVEMMAKDDLKGREIGSEGYEIAAKYVAAEFEKVGLRPGGSASSYMQKVRFLSRRIDESKSSLTLVREGKEEKLTLGEDANIGIRNAPAPKVDAEMFFVGYTPKFLNTITTT